MYVTVSSIYTFYEGDSGLNTLQSLFRLCERDVAVPARLESQPLSENAGTQLVF